MSFRLCVGVESFNFSLCVCVFGLVAYVLVCGCVGVARDRGKQPEASSSRQSRGEEPCYMIKELVLILICFRKCFVF